MLELRCKKGATHVFSGALTEFFRRSELEFEDEANKLSDGAESMDAGGSELLKGPHGHKKITAG